MARSEFPAKVRQAAWDLCKGRCEAEGCGIKLQVGKFHFDHAMPGASWAQAKPMIQETTPRI